MTDLTKGIFIKGKRWYRWNQFPTYGKALNYCVKHNIPIKRIKKTYYVDGSFDCYVIQTPEIKIPWLKPEDFFK